MAHVEQPPQFLIRQARDMRAAAWARPRWRRCRHLLALAVVAIAGCRASAQPTADIISTSLAQVPITDAPDTPARSTATSSPLLSGDEASGPSILRETRALWTWAGRSAKTKSDIDELVELVDSAHLNVILFGVYYRGTAYFEPSSMRFPIAAERLLNQSRFGEAGYTDALRYLLEVRDARRADSDPANDFEVHAWFTVHLNGDSERTWPPTDLTQPYMLNALFPEFQVKYGTYYTRQDERFINPAVSAVEQPRFRQYMVDLIAGVAEEYAIDGVHLDYVRVGQICFNAESLDYPGTEFDYAGCQEDYRAFTRETFGREYALWDDTDGVRQIADGGSGRVAAWQVRTVGRLVRAIHAEVKTVRPDLIISVASVRNVPWELPIQGQVAWRWLDAGWIDAIFPTLYLDSTQAIVDRMERLREAVQDTSKRGMIFAGLATHSFEDRTEDWSGLVVERVDAVLREAPDTVALQPAAHGVALFRGEYLSQTTIEALSAGPFREPAIPYWRTPVP